jgi:hypothetical protein
MGRTTWWRTLWAAVNRYRRDANRGARAAGWRAEWKKKKTVDPFCTLNKISS